ncbi:MAG: hypothetical protein LBP61_10435 [Desulfovibrio sp.]|jgi:hypothetical protein|nr:hypothetical protein [Desulfovibrio sp.]
MIPCHVCGRDASTGWIVGLPPSPDSQKLALCSRHDTPKNRILLEKSWTALLTRSIAAAESVIRHKASPPARKIVTIRFTAGGALSFTATRCVPTNHSTLCIEEEDGGRTYIPMPQIRDYTVRPVTRTDVQDERPLLHPRYVLQRDTK